ncbi:MAG: hypothetical protein AB7K52_12465 [Phycisphaerales bacterium]
MPPSARSSFSSLQTQPPTLVLSLVLALSLLLAASSVAALAACFLGGAGSPVPWFTAFFEVIVLLAALFGVLLGRGRFASGRSMTLVCIAGAVFASSVLGYRACAGQLMGGPVLWGLLGRVALAGAFGLLAAALVMARTPGRSLRYLAGGFALLTPVAGVAAGWAFGFLSGPLSSLSGTAKTGVIGFAMLIGAVLISVGTHLVIRAFEVALPPDERAAE